MEVETIQKINNLALELMKQGLAKDRSDAVIQAEKIYVQQNGGDYTCLRRTMEEVKNEQEGMPKREVDLSSENIKEILEQNTSFIVKKLKEFQDKMTSFENEIAALRTKMTYERPVPRPALSSSIQEAEIPKPAPKITRETAPDHPRSGAYRQEDVSIEKFFYMGGKR